MYQLLAHAWQLIARIGPRAWILSSPQPPVSPLYQEPVWLHRSDLRLVHTPRVRVNPSGMTMSAHVSS